MGCRIVSRIWWTIRSIATAKVIEIGITKHTKLLTKKQKSWAFCYASWKNKKLNQKENKAKNKIKKEKLPKCPILLWNYHTNTIVWMCKWFHFGGFKYFVLIHNTQYHCDLRWSLGRPEIGFCIHVESNLWCNFDIVKQVTLPTHKIFIQIIAFKVFGLVFVVKRQCINILESIETL